MDYNRALIREAVNTRIVMGIFERVAQANKHFFTYRKSLMLNFLRIN